MCWFNFVLYTSASLCIECFAAKECFSGNTIIVTMVQVANSFCTALAVITKNVVQNQTSSVVSGYQWSFGTTILVTFIACLLILGIKNQAKQ